MNKEQIEDMPRVNLEEWLQERIDNSEDARELAETVRERFQTAEQKPEERVHKLTTHFQFGELPVIEIGDDLFFLADSAAKWLGFDNAIKAVNKYCTVQGVQKFSIQADNGIREMAFICEQDLYALAFSSDTPAAQEFTSSMMSTGIKILKGDIVLKDSPKNDMDSARLAFNDIVERIYAENEIVATNVKEAADKAKRLAVLKEEFYKRRDNLNKAYGFDK